MKRRDAGRVLTFAVTGALLGGVGLGGCNRHRGPYVNPGPDVTTPPPSEPVDGTEPTEPEPEPPEHVNEGPVEEPPAEPPIDEGTNNVRKVEDEPHKVVKYVNPARVADEPAPQPKK